MGGLARLAAKKGREQGAGSRAGTGAGLSQRG